MVTPDIANTLNEVIKNAMNQRLIGALLEVATVASGFFAAQSLRHWEANSALAKVFLVDSLVLAFITFPFLPASFLPLWVYIASWIFFFFVGILNPDWYFTKYLGK